MAININSLVNRAVQTVKNPINTNPIMKVISDLVDNVLMPQQANMSYIDAMPTNVIAQQPQNIGMMQTPNAMSSYGDIQPSITQSIPEAFIPQPVAPQIQPKTQPTHQSVQPQAVAPQQSYSEHIQQGVMTLQDLLGGLLSGITQPLTQPMINEQGNTSTLYDMMRFVANTQAPELGKMWEGDLKTKKETITATDKANRDLVAKELERQQKFQDDIALTTYKSQLEAAKDEGKVDDKDASIIQKQINDFKSDKIVEKAKTSITEAQGIRSVLESGNPIGDKAVKILMPRMLGEVGNLTKAEQDVYGGSAKLTSTIKQVMKNWSTGRLTKENREFLLDLVNTLEKAGIEKLNNVANQYKQSLKSLRPKLDGNLIDSAFQPFLGQANISEQQGILMEDANGNKAIVYPDGRIEEL